MRIGILGGNFDPPHKGHLLVAKQVLVEKDLDEVWLMPCSKNPVNYKESKTVATSKERLRMCELAVENIHRLKVSDYEIKKGGKSYTVDTLKALKQDHKNHNFCWIIGSDITWDYKEWRNWDEIERMGIKFYVVPRSGYLIKELAENMELIDNPVLFDISSSEIKERIKQGLDVSEFLPSKVEDYIRKNEIYFEKIQKRC